MPVPTLFSSPFQLPRQESSNHKPPMKTAPSFFLFLLLATVSPALKSSAADTPDTPDPFHWPTPTRENHPWTRWWWMGSAVDKTNLTRQLEMFKAAGIGGVEITPIYGAHGYESNFIDFLSPKWMEMLAHTTSEANRLGLGVDLTTGTGWPNGGPMVTTEMASGSIVMERYDLAGGASLATPFPAARTRHAQTLQTLRAIGEHGTQIDLTDKVANGHLDWIAPPGNWRLYAIWETGPAQQVKRAAPGGTGNVLDPFSTQSLDAYLGYFDDHFKVYTGAMPRSFFHDSYEYYDAQWTPSFFSEFARLRGYDLRTQLPAFFGEGPATTAERVRSDYRQTIADLHLAYIQEWNKWSHGHGSITREQAHGAPANLIDVYAAADIPETEMMPFANQTEEGYVKNKFASSATRDKGSALTSSESFTWLTEHFNCPLSLVKQAADFLFLTGVNHIFFHGIPYSPADAPWPGWQFYASVNFGPTGGLWHDLPNFNAYVTRIQSILQTGSPANDILLYYNIFDVPDRTGTRATGLITAGNGPMPESLLATAATLLKRGYSFDYVSDRFLAEATTVQGNWGGEIKLGGGGSLRNDIPPPYQIMLNGRPARLVLVPPCRFMPATTLEKLVQLAKDGGTVAFMDHLPSDVPGMSDLEQQQAKFKSLLSQIKFEISTPVKEAKLGNGTILLSSDVGALLTEARAIREPMVDKGIWFVRRTSPGGYNYFIANRGQTAVDGWVALGIPFHFIVLLDPLFVDRSGYPRRAGASGEIQFDLQLLPGESRILRIFTNTSVVAGPSWVDTYPTGTAQELTGSWSVKFVDGGPALPQEYTTTNLASWTTRDDPELKRFAGTAVYTLTFDHPNGDAADWILDLGKVCEAAHVKMNGKDVGALWCAPYKITIGKYLVLGKNILEVEVTNLAANRVRDLDLRHVNWKYFYDANINPWPNGGQRTFDASRWPLRNSGLLGPVQLQPVKKLAL
jgi:alpha-L-rhamnosidase